MKLVLGITDFGSFNNFLAELALKFLQEKTNEIHVICDKSRIINLEDKYNYNHKNLHFHFVPFTRGANVFKTFATAIKIRRLIKEIKPNLIHAHFTTGIFPAILFRNKGVPYWGTFHGLGMNSSDTLKKKVLFSIIEKICFMRLDRIFLVNDQDQKLLSQLGFEPKTTKYECYGFGCDVAKFDSNRFDDNFKQVLKAKLGIKDEKVIAFTGRFVHFKGFDVVIKAFFRIVEKHPEKYKLLLIGGPDPGHSTGLSKEEQLRVCKSNSIINVGFTNEVPDYLAISDIFLFPSKKEGLPTCVMEALSFGVPVIVSDTRGSNDIVINGINGYLIQEEDEIDRIIHALEELCIYPDKYEEIRQNALRQRERYSRENFIDYHLSLYNKIRVT